MTTTKAEPGDRVRITYEATALARGYDIDRPGDVLLGEFEGEDWWVGPDGTERRVVNVEILKPPPPAFINGDVCRSKAFPGSVCVRSDGMWRWTDDPKRGWDDDRTAGHLASGYYVGIRIAGKAAQS